MTISAIQTPWLSTPAKPAAERVPPPASIDAVSPVSPPSAVAAESSAAAARPTPMPDLHFPDPLPDLPKIDMPEPRPVYAAALDILRGDDLPTRQLR